MSEKPPRARFLVYLLSFTMPLVGLVVGMVYSLRQEEEPRRFGKICLIIGIVAIIFACIALLVWLAFFFFEIF